MQNLLGNIRYALRQFRHSPVFTAAAVLTLALGIGGTTAIFSLVDSVMLRSLPVSDPGTLYRIGDGDECCVESGPQEPWGMFSFPLYERMKENLPEFEEITAFQAGGNRMSVRRESDRTAKPLRTEYVTGSYFSTFGIRSFGGRLLSEADDHASAPPVAVLSYHVWQGDYGSDPSVLGSTFVIESHPFTIIGVAPPGFFGETLRGDPPDVWIPIQQEPLLRGDASLLRQAPGAWLRVIGRLRPGATTAGVSPRLTGILRTWMVNDSGYPANWMDDVKRALPKAIVRVVPAGAGVGVMKENYSRSLQILLAVCGVVLLIACANVANLLLARAVARRGQTAIRMALGASRSEIVWQALVESVLLSLMGGLAGLLVAVGAERLLLTLAFDSVSFLPISTTPSLLVLAFAFLLSLITGMIFGAAPAWFATRAHPVEALRGAGRSTHDTTTFARKALLIVQATLSVILVAGATMLARSLGNLEHQDFGFKTENRITVQLNSPPASYTPDRLRSLYRELENHLRAMPGVEQEGLALYNPLTDNWGELILVEGHPPPKVGEDSDSSWDRVSAGYFAAVGQPVLRGRGFTDADNETTAPVAVVNEAFVRRFFPNEDPLEKHFGMDLPELAGTFRIVGVIRDAKYAGWGLYRPAMPMFFVPLAQFTSYKDAMMARVETQSHFIGGMVLLTHSMPGAVEATLTRTLADVDPNLTIVRVRTMQQQIDVVFSQERAVAGLAGLFGIVALILAAVGLYGVTAYSVAQRTNEIGVRMALGAGRGRVVQMVLSGAFRRVGIGLLLGVPLAIGAGRLLAAQLYGVSSWDPVALSVAALSLAGCAFLAAIIPALRAAAISPMEALRME
ncbi:MAG TPA: ABC transporter permease [Candidatus Acidoferrum sp.]|nr:ABC transporter permease [Candidatus Acidoferrum sp.]